MFNKFCFILQDSIIKDINITTSIPEDLVDYKIIKLNNYVNDIANISTQIISQNSKPIVFSSINIANYIIKNNSILKNGIILPHLPYTNGILDWNYYSTTIPSEYLLNPDGIILPFSKILENKKKIIKEYGEKFFIKPLSCWKPFTGFDTIISDLEYDISSYKQHENIKNYELCLITSYKSISNIEYRFWVVDGEIVTYAPYNINLHNTPLNIPPSDETIKIVKNAAEYLSIYDNCFVIDSCMTNDGPKVVEINGFSTSGWYNGIDTEKIFQATISLF
jgi:hypothetical protein